MVQIYQGSLFSNDFLNESITRLSDWKDLNEAEVLDFASRARAVFAQFPTGQSPNETQTEDDLIWKILDALGWKFFLRQQNLAPKGRDDVPDGILFRDESAKVQANKSPQEWKRYEFGLAIVESKRWERPLDRRSGQRGEETAPSTQMLRYLRRVEDLTTGKLRWGILTNGGRWRLYYQGARSVAENFFEVDLAQVLGIEGHEGGLFALNADQQVHALRVFYLIFRQGAFVGTASDPRTFHQRALEEGKFYEERVSSNLSNLVFGEVFPKLVRGIAAAAPDAALHDVRDAALIVLYRLLFILYAEDRDLLPIRDSRYAQYGLRTKVRGDVGDRKNRNDTFSETAARYWAAIDDLSRAIDEGDPSVGLPAYDGGLFDRKRTPLLTRIRISDSVIADVIDALSYERTPSGRRYINYRDLSVQQLGSIYERLLEFEIVRDGDVINIRPNIFARKRSGSYYTPDDLVTLIIRETIAPLVAEKTGVFASRLEEQAKSNRPLNEKLGVLKRHDPADRILELKICDPAMGSGHFLVALVDYLADQVITAMADSEAAVTWGHYVSPLSDRIEAIRNTILGNAEARGWRVETAQLDDRHIIRRMILKRCVYGVDKNLMAVELAKVSLWLHTFTVGAPLSFLDHHLRCGDSLFGLWVKAGFAKANLIEFGKTRKDRKSQTLFLHEPMTRALRAASSMQIIEGLTDAEIAEAHRSADIFAEIEDMTAPLWALLSFFHALDWLELNNRENRPLLQGFLSGVYGDPVQVALGKFNPSEKDYGSQRAKNEAHALMEILAQVRAIVSEERFFHWQVAFPGVWSRWEEGELVGGFDAIVGNPPWDRLKLQDVDWFVARRPEVALAQRASDRKKLISNLKRKKDPLARDYEKAADRAEAAVRIARDDGNYPFLSSGDVNIYSLFVEQAMRLIKPNGFVGLLIPSGIASDYTAAPFFMALSTSGRLKAIFDFENKGEGRPLYFPDVHAQFKFCALIASRSSQKEPARCAFFLNDPSEIGDQNRCFTLTAADFARLNPNTGTAPLFRTRRDADLTTAIYGRLPILVHRMKEVETKTWPTQYVRVYDMTNDSGLFRTLNELEKKEAAYPVGGNRYKSPKGEWLPLYEGKMIWHFDHRAASVEVNPDNPHRPAFPRETTIEEHSDPTFTPTPQFWVLANGGQERDSYALGFRDVTNPTDRRTMDACFIPYQYAGNTLPLVLNTNGANAEFALLCANFNSLILDYVARQKVQKNHLNWYVVEQLPIVPFARYSSTIFGKKDAAKIVRDATLELTYTSNDLAEFARDMGYVQKNGSVHPPFRWDENRRRSLRAKLDAIYFYLYGVTDRKDVQYVFSTFDIIEEEEVEAYGRYLSLELCLSWMNALAAGDTEANIEVRPAKKVVGAQRAGG